MKPQPKAVKANGKLALHCLAEFLSTPMPYSELRFDKNGRRYWVHKHTPTTPAGANQGKARE